MEESLDIRLPINYAFLVDVRLRVLITYGGNYGISYLFRASSIFSTLFLVLSIYDYILSLKIVSYCRNLSAFSFRLKS